MAVIEDHNSYNLINNSKIVDLLLYSRQKIVYINESTFYNLSN